MAFPNTVANSGSTQAYTFWIIGLEIQSLTEVGKNLPNVPWLEILIQNTSQVQNMTVLWKKKKQTAAIVSKY